MEFPWARNLFVVSTLGGCTRALTEWAGNRLLVTDPPSGVSFLLRLGVIFAPQLQHGVRVSGVMFVFLASLVVQNGREKQTPAATPVRR